MERDFVEHPMVRERALLRREYQVRIAEAALRGNTLVVLPTALGKTVIAELVVAEVLHRYPGSRALLMAPTKPLVLQHASSLLAHLRLDWREVAALTGDVPDRERYWLDPRVRVILATPQTVWNDLSRGLVNLEEFAVVVMDECHRSRERYAYTRIANEYVKVCPWPLILALTASPGSDPERVKELVRNLWIERFEWRTEEDEDVRPYIPGVDVSWVSVSLPEQYERVRSKIREMIESRLERLRSTGIVALEGVEFNRRSLLAVMERLKAELRSGARGLIAHALVVLSEVLSLFYALELVESQHASLLLGHLEEARRSKRRSHRTLSSSPDFRELVELARSCDAEHPKVEALLDVLGEHLSSNPSDRVLVFANLRSTAELLVERVRSKGFSVHLFVGKAEGKSGPRMRQEEQVRILREFRAGRFNVLVATSIGEEGLDVPECGLVVFYEPTVSGIRYIQRRGRTGRRFPGKVVILVTKGTIDEYYFREGYRRARRVERVLRLVSRDMPGVLVPRRGPEPASGQPWPWTDVSRLRGGEAASTDERKLRLRTFTVDPRDIIKHSLTSFRDAFVKPDRSSPNLTI
ncbi:MAG: helicase-related protein [Candidatus Caldarchaeales archaeon]